MGLTLNEVKILALQTSGATRAALEAIGGDTKGTGRIRVAPKEERTADGIVFASKREMDVYQTLKIAENVGMIHGLKLQPRYVLQPKMVLADGTKQRAIVYVLDFQFERGGKTVVVDVKGMETEVWKLKAKMFRARYPELTFEIWK